MNEVVAVREGNMNEGGLVTQQADQYSFINSLIKRVLR